MGIRFVSRELGPFIGHFVARDALVAWAPPDLDPDAGLLGPKGGDVPPGLEGVLLPGSRFVGDHPPYGRLAVCQDGYRPSVWFLVAATCRALAKAAHLAP